MCVKLSRVKITKFIKTTLFTVSKNIESWSIIDIISPIKPLLVNCPGYDTSNSEKDHEWYSRVSERIVLLATWAIENRYIKSEIVFINLFFNINLL
jgi:hypothetical protein